MEKIQLETVQWNTMPHIDDVDSISDGDYEVIREIGEVLRRHGREEKFGVCLLHKHFNLKEGERMCEETDFENKMLISRIASASDYSEKEIIETMWRFPRGIQAVTVCERVCDYFLGHKSRHKKVAR